ncbi:MAG: hypothetical protein IKW86_08810 [Salinivirgaceae bacterium]|nr:hypothetical protein [Salinivirgaceae bacterium]MBR5378753.1 hypothetical protein [Bacteroidales bacterium]
MMYNLFTSSSAVSYIYVDERIVVVHVDEKNANARLYDPVIGHFFSPDPFVQAPDFTQNYNRYSYCLNNPVMFSDTDRMETVKKIKKMC